MTATKRKRKRIGSGRSVSPERRRRFVHHYIANGRNATQAAIAAGWPETSAYQRGFEMVHRKDVQALIETEVSKIAAVVGLSAEATLREVARLAYTDMRRFYYPDGTLKPVSDWTDDMAACVKEVEVEELFDGRGEDRKQIGHIRRLKLFDKNAALDKAMKHLGLYEKDNRQQGQNLAIQINIVGKLDADQAGPPTIDHERRTD